MANFHGETKFHTLRNETQNGGQNPLVPQKTVLLTCDIIILLFYEYFDDISLISTLYILISFVFCNWIFLEVIPHITDAFQEWVERVATVSVDPVDI